MKCVFLCESNMDVINLNSVTHIRLTLSLHHLLLGYIDLSNSPS